MRRDSRSADSSPKRDIHRSDVVCMPSEAARLTFEFKSRWPVLFRYMAARRTSPRSISGINQNQWHTSYLGFVLNKGPEHPEIPGMQVATLRLSHRISGSDALKIFKRNRSQSVFGLRNYLLGNAMVDILREPGHSARKLLEMAFGRFGASLLKTGLKRIKSISGLIDLIAAMYLAIRINSKILDTQICPKSPFGIIGDSSGVSTATQR
jgi:hypothetical protein